MNSPTTNAEVSGAGPARRTRRASPSARGLALAGWMGALLVLPVAAQIPVQEVPDVAAPLSPGDPRTPMARAAAVVWNKTLGDRAIEGGFHSLAAGYYREILERDDLGTALRDDVALRLVTALVAMGDAAAAAQTLEQVIEARGPDWVIRRAAIDFLRRDLPAVTAALEGLTPEVLPPADESLYHFLRAMLLDSAGEAARADVVFEEAIAKSRSAGERALYSLARYQRRLNPGEVTDGSAAKLKADIEQYQGRTVAFQLTLVHAAVLDRLNRQPEALETLKRQARQLPAEETSLRDLTLLLTGLIAGAQRDDGRRAFEELVADGADPEWQRVGLLKLAAALPREGGAGVEAFQRLLDTLLARTPAHPLTEEMLFFRAELALRSRALARADADADALLTRYPLSPLRRSALALMASSSWLNLRYRTAAGFIAQIRNVLPPGPERTGLGALMGECYYRAGMLPAGTAEDFRNAAEGYGVALAEMREGGAGLYLPGIQPGTLFFQRVISLIKADDIGAAVAMLDGPLAAGIEDESRWQAEWNLARFQQLRNRQEDAFRRATTAVGVPGLSPGLRLRFLWLATQLTVDTGKPEETPDRVAQVVGFLESEAAAGIEPGLRNEVLSNAALLLARAQLARDRSEEGFAALEKLRGDFPGSRAAIYSYIVQARALAAANRLADAQKLLISLREAHPESEYAPLALYEAAQQAKGRGQDIYLQEASRLLGEMAVAYQEEQYVFPARLKQADVLRELNQFGVAEGIYQHLENTYPNRPDRLIVEMSLADTLMAQAPGDPAKFEGAVSRYERLTDLPDPAPIDLRIEAGVKLGYGWLNQGQPATAARVFWDVYNRFLGDRAVAEQVGATGRYWLAKGVFELGLHEERAGRLDAARRLYQAVLDHGLPFELNARGRLARLQPAASSP